MARACPENSAKYDYEEQFRNSAYLYAADSPTVHPLDIIVLSEAATVPVPQRGNNGDFVQTKPLSVLS